MSWQVGLYIHIYRLRPISFTMESSPSGYVGACSRLGQHDDGWSPNQQRWPYLPSRIKRSSMLTLLFLSMMTNLRKYFSDLNPTCTARAAIMRTGRSPCPRSLLLRPMEVAWSSLHWSLGFPHRLEPVRSLCPEVVRRLDS